MTSEGGNVLREERLPNWMKSKLPGGPNFLKLRTMLRDSTLHTVCEEAHCPNIGECWENLSATFMILGAICTWRCHYCAVTTGRPDPLDPNEPRRLADTVSRLNLRYCVITSVTRDDLDDGGAGVFAECINKIHLEVPNCKIEVLIPDFQGDDQALSKVLATNPDVLNHNIETVPRIFRLVRPKGSYERSIRLLKRSKEISPGIPTKSGMMVGLGETLDELRKTMEELRDVGCDLLTIGQYLRPSKIHYPVKKFYHPDEFSSLKELGENLGFQFVSAGPMVRSSYQAEEQANALKTIPI